MDNLNSDKMVPLYQQLYETLKEQIKTGLYKPGDKILSEGELSQRYGISRVTVRAALDHMVSDNILVKKQGKGTFVAQPVRVESMSADNSFTKSCLAINAVPSTNVISLSKEAADEAMALILGIETGEMSICMKRLRLIDGKPALLEIDFFPPSCECVLQHDIAATPLLEFLQKYAKLYAGNMESIFEVKRAQKEQAGYLECTAGTPLLKVSQTIYTESGSVLYYNEQYIRSDHYKLAMRAPITL